MGGERRKCCLIGGGGFIGAHVTRLLADAGREVVVLGRHAAASTVLPKNVVYVSGDYGDKATLRRLLAGTDEVIDLAYSTAPQTSFADPIFDIVSNLPASVGLLQESVAAGIQKVVLVSSGGTVYGVARSLPIVEDHPTRPISPYGITKLAIENYGWMFKALFNLPVVVVRPGNAYGAGQRTLSGQGFIAAAIHSITEDHAVDIFGEQGTTRDYIHVTDVAAGIVAALESGVPGMAYNIGTAEGWTNMQIVEMIKPLATAAGLEVKTKHLPPRDFDVPVNCLNSGKLRSISGWRPRVSLQDGIRRLWDASSAGRR
jgi:UDP-glucose 4-epimerase